MTQEPWRSGLWAKIDVEVARKSPSDADSSSGQRDSAGDWKRYWRFRRPLLDVYGVALWGYAFLKLFVFDVDREILGSAADYRGLIAAGLAVVLVLVLHKPWPTVAGFVYIAFFPLVVFTWKLPKRILKSKSTVSAMAVANVVASFAGGLKRCVLAGSAALFATVGTLASSSSVVLAACLAVSAGLAVAIVWRTVSVSLQPSAFMKTQQAMISRAAHSDVVGSLLEPPAELKTLDVVKFTKTQQDLFIQHVGQGVLAQKALSYWANELEQYRRSAAGALFNALTYLWLTVRLVFLLALIGYGIYGIDPSLYKFSDPPSLIVFFRYVIAALYGAEISALQPAGDLTSAVSVLTFLVGVGLLGTLLLSSALSFRAARDDSAIRDTIEQIHAETVSVDQRFRDHYEVSVDEAISRLEEIRWGLLGLVGFLTSRIPSPPVEK